MLKAAARRLASSQTWRAALLPCLLAVTGCDSSWQQLRATFATDFECRGPISISETDGHGHYLPEGRYLIKGCGHRVVYQCIGNNVCAIQTVREGPARGSATRDDERRRTPARFSSRPHLETRGPDDVLSLEVPLAPRSTLRLSGAPQQHPDLVQIKLLRQNQGEDVGECNLDLMLNGQVVQIPKATANREGLVISHRVQVSGSLIDELGASRKLALRVCDERWSLNDDQLEALHEFIDRFQEEVAWKVKARSGNAAGMLPPSGGWPEWSAVGNMPMSVTSGAVLDATALYKKLGVSVFQLEATREQGVAQGSAVAVSTTELLTNCHVLQGALKLQLKQGKKSWPARVLRADPSTDRCVIGASGVTLQPVSGVRSYDSLQVGEAAYTLGSPVGLELTLSNGLVSGRRDEEQRHYVQTTAPISPGSSGGGLFDARGNLIGITTLALVGRERLNQSLNFAIPADAFYGP